MENNYWTRLIENFEDNFEEDFFVIFWKLNIFDLGDSNYVFEDVDRELVEINNKESFIDFKIYIEYIKIMWDRYLIHELVYYILNSLVNKSAKIELLHRIPKLLSYELNDLLNQFKYQYFLISKLYEVSDKNKQIIDNLRNTNESQKSIILEEISNSYIVRWLNDENDKYLIEVMKNIDNYQIPFVLTNLECPNSLIKELVYLLENNLSLSFEKKIEIIFNLWKYTENKIREIINILKTDMYKYYQLQNSKWFDIRLYQKKEKVKKIEWEEIIDYFQKN